MRCRGGGQFTPPLGKVSFFGVMGSPPPKMAVLKAPPWLVKRWMGRVEAGGRFRTFWCSQKPKKQPSVFAEISFGYSQLGFLMLQSHPFHILGVQSNIKSASNTKKIWCFWCPLCKPSCIKCTIYIKMEDPVLGIPLLTRHFRVAGFIAEHAFLTFSRYRVHRQRVLALLSTFESEELTQTIFAKIFLFNFIKSCGGKQQKYGFMLKRNIWESYFLVLNFVLRLFHTVVLYGSRYQCNIFPGG